MGEIKFEDGEQLFEYDMPWEDCAILIYREFNIEDLDRVIVKKFNSKEDMVLFTKMKEAESEVKSDYSFVMVSSFNTK